jgi:tetratricopeptide (TPR) repeat protein
MALASSPNNLAALFNLGKVLEVQRRFDEAAEAYEKILRKQPGNVETRLRLGIVRYQQEAYDDAIALFQEILKNDPGNGTAALSLGVAYNTLGLYEESILVLRRLLAREPDQAEAVHALGDSLVELHRAEEAIRLCEAALSRDPSDAQSTILLGQAECDRGDFTAAERHFRRAVLLAPQRYEANMNLGVLYQRLGRIDDALSSGKKAVELGPREPLAHMNYGMGLLLAGDLARGWREVEWRMHDPRMRAHFPYREHLPLWTGERIGGKLLVAREQGLGDFIVSARFFAQLTGLASEVVVEVPPELFPLFAEREDIRPVADRIDPSTLGEFTAHVPLCSLPFVLGINQNNVPAPIPYLAAPIAARRQFRERFVELGDDMKVGLVWAGSPGHLLNRYRSAPASTFSVFAGIEGVRWVSLQKGAHEPMLALEVLDLAPELKDFGVTAGALQELDLLISVDTAVAHLAGALGTPVWLLNGFGSYWLWQLQRTDSPWYPTMRLFRQRSFNDWKGMLFEVRSALDATLQTRA